MADGFAHKTQYRRACNIHHLPAAAAAVVVAEIGVAGSAAAVAVQPVLGGVEVPA